jgi:DNA repair exonuclease SbcCD ATPase subunit
MRFAHFGDVHFRPLVRHDEYKQIFEEFFAMDLDLDHIVISGDIVHEKTQRITPEIIDVLVWWFQEMAKICKVHVILGNHDGNLKNEKRQDAISPILTAIASDNIFLYKDSDVYAIDDKYNLCVFSPFDEEGWKDVAPEKGKINIALFHGSVQGAVTDIGHELDGEVDLKFFDRFDFSMLGDIHRHQFLDDEKRVAYPGSTVQQDFGESIDRHGFLVWDINTADDFTVKHYELENICPFVTIPWRGDLKTTVEESLAYPNKSRFRIYNKEQLSQKDVAAINNELKREKLSETIVYKFEKKKTGGVKSEITEEFRRNLRDPSSLLVLLKDFLGEDTFEDSQWGEIYSIVKKYARSISGESTTRGTVWSPHKVEFNNLMQYGENNLVNLSGLDGIVGVFGPNRHGKSTIIAAMTYALFGKLDRDINQNHNHGIVNYRKVQCFCKFYFTISGTNYLIHRATSRVEKADGRYGAKNDVWFYEMDGDWNEIKPLHDIKGTETDKIIRNLVGTIDDFKLTALASQRNMEAFIGEKSTDRKNHLSRFRDLQPLQDLHNQSKSDLKDSKAVLKSLTPIDWSSAIENLISEKDSLSKDIIQINSLLEILRESLQEKNKELSSTDNSADVVTQDEVDEQEGIVEKLEESIEKAKIDIRDTELRKISLSKKIEEISEEKKSIPIEKIKKKLEKKIVLEKTIAELSEKLKSEIRFLEGKEKTVKKLDVVPCGDQFPKCHYIKDAHEDKLEIKPQKELIDSIRKQIQKCDILIVDDDYKDKVKEYENLDHREIELIKKLSSINVEKIKNRLEIAEEKLGSANERLTYLRSNVSDEEIGDELVNLKKKISSIRAEISDHETKKMDAAMRIGKIDSEVESHKEEQFKFSEINETFRMYEQLTLAFGKKGIPNHIIRKDLPRVNGEIREVLRGVFTFDIELEVEEESDKLEIYIDYGDSRRPIELGSGMEQCIASMAIRVGLLNASNLPKPNVLILDEPFNHLDDGQIDDVIRMIESLKKWFKTIFIISHKESVKDMADHLLDIQKKGKDSYIFFE